MFNSLGNGEDDKAITIKKGDVVAARCTMV
jgi:hypothetical protein